MTATVLYTEDLEPITVIDVPQWALERLKNREPIRFVVPPSQPVRYTDASPIYEELRTVTIWGEPFVRGEVRSTILFTKQDEWALLLDSDRLPGQQRAFQDEYKRGIVAGIIGALGMGND